MIYYKKKIQQDVGATAIEYGLIASLIGVLAVSGMSAVGVNLSNTYCTVSKYLGGSGKCSGGSSKGTGENGSGGSAGSGNNTTGNGENGSGTPIITKDDMDNLENSLVDDFDDSYLDSSLGGTNKEDVVSSIPAPLFSLMDNYNKQHPNDQITNVFGLYDSLTHQPITSWSKVYQAFNNGDTGSMERGNNNFHELEFTTQQGHVYSIDGMDSTATITEQLMKGS